MDEDFKYYVIESLKQLNAESDKVFQTMVFAESKILHPRTIMSYTLAEIFEDWDYDLSRFFSSVMNSKNLALVEEDFVHVYIPTVKPKLNITFISGTKKERYVFPIIEKQGKRVLGKLKLQKNMK